MKLVTGTNTRFIVETFSDCFFSAANRLSIFSCVSTLMGVVSTATESAMWAMLSSGTGDIWLRTD